MVVTSSRTALAFSYNMYKTERQTSSFHVECLHASPVETSATLSPKQPKVRYCNNMQSTFPSPAPPLQKGFCLLYDRAFPLSPSSLQNSRLPMEANLQPRAAWPIRHWLDASLGVTSIRLPYVRDKPVRVSLRTCLLYAYNALLQEGAPSQCPHARNGFVPGQCT